MPFLLIYDFNFNYFSPVEEEQNQFGKGINSVGGWLMVIQVFIFLNAYGWIRNLQVFSALFGEKDNLIRSQGISNPALYNAFIYYELAASIIFIVFSVAMVYYMFKRSRMFPLLFIIYLILDLVTDAFVLVIFGAVSESPAIIKQKLIFGLIIAVFMITYIRFSKRVKATFIK